MVTPWITVAEALAQLRLVDPQPAEVAADLDQKIAAATTLLRNRIVGSLTDADEIALIGAWDATTVDAGVKAATLVQLGELWRVRGDDLPMPPAESGRLSPMVERYLTHWVIPTLA